MYYLEKDPLFYLECIDKCCECGFSGILCLTENNKSNEYFFSCSNCSDNFSDPDPSIWFAMIKWNKLQRSRNK
jgi:hypothetical protein